MYTEAIASFPYGRTGLNPYDIRRPTPYNETALIGFYNTAAVQAQLGVLTNSAQPAKVFDAHSNRVNMEYVYSGDWDLQTDALIERLLQSGVSVLIYEGLVDWICNYLGVREIAANLPNFTHQAAFNKLSMVEWSPVPALHSVAEQDKREASAVAGAYKCLRTKENGGGRANLCYLELEGAGHVASLDKPMETSLMLAKWMNELGV